MFNWIKQLFSGKQSHRSEPHPEFQYDPFAVDECCYPSRSIPLDSVKMPAPGEDVRFKTYGECIAYTFKSGEICMFEWSDKSQMYEKVN